MVWYCTLDNCTNIRQKQARQYSKFMQIKLNGGQMSILFRVKQYIAYIAATHTLCRYFNIYCMIVRNSV